MVYETKEDLIQQHIREEDVVLDIGFYGQGTAVDNPKWIHSLLKARAKKVYGLDLEFPAEKFVAPMYVKASAEDFTLPEKVDVIFAGDIIEHLSNPGNFLASCAENLKDGGRLIITTPNAFNLFNIAEKFSKDEPTVNAEHTCYYNKKTIHELISRYPYDIQEVSYVYRLFTTHKESLKKKFLNVFYKLFSLATPKFTETLVVVCQKKGGGTI
jgi:2-polyprenyl-3-methyl-5-hydroxy-6-metoxy-1,4-benzoquinol methylase